MGAVLRGDLPAGVRKRVHEGAEDRVEHASITQRRRRHRLTDLLLMQPALGVLAGQVGTEHRRIVGGKHDGDPVTKERGERVIFNTGLRAAQLERKRSGADVALRANFKWNAPIGK